MTEFTPPGELEEYRVVRPLGRGGMGAVYLAHDTLLDRPVALKFVSGEVDRAMREQFFAEARAIARLQHPNVVAVHRVGELRRRPYLVSEFVRGVSLDKLERPQPWPRALEIGVGLARGLAAAHRRGVLHRDLKPHNAMLTDEGEVKLLDFGLAHLQVEEGDPRRAPSGGGGPVLGTPLYMAPEAWRGEPPTPAVDLYALGVVLYELLSGAAPFSGVPLEDLPRRVSEHDAPPLLERAPTVEPALAEIVDRCLKRDPAARPPSAEALRDALERVRARARPQAVPEGNPYRGLAAYEAEHRGLFFGRDAEVSALVDRLRSEPFVLVAGDSGVGKSSLCRAGVLPRIADGELRRDRGFDVVSLVPGRRPLGALCAALAPLLALDEGTLADQLAAEPGALGRRLRLRPRGMLVFVDQLEELLTLAAEDEAATFAAALGGLLLPSSGVRLLATLRADFLGRLAALPALGDEVSRALYLVRPLSEDGVREAIVGPAARKGFRFESPELVERLAQSGLRTGGGLPLLSFALAELWDARDEARQVIPAEALDRLGGVAGALARHADGVLAALTPEAQAAARRVLTALVTDENTRSRRAQRELAGDDPAARVALEALVRGRLVTARGAEEGGDGTCEIAHEALIGGWDTLREWLSTDAEARATRSRLERAAKEWERLGRARESLYSGRALTEVLALDLRSLGARERAFVEASRRLARQRRWRRIGAFAAPPLVVAAALAAAFAQSRAVLEANVRARLTEGERILDGARARGAAAQALRAQAFARYDAGDWERGDQVWTRALADAREAEQELARAASAIEGALALDPSRAALRARYADVLVERLLGAEREHRKREAAELFARLALYDDGSRRRALEAPARIALRLSPADARVTLARYDDRDGRRILTALGPLKDGPVAPGSYLLEARAPGHAPARLALALRRGETATVALTLPREAEVPPGFVYVPAGRFLFGTYEDELVRRAFHATPLHEVATGPYLIGRHEVTFGDWIAWLRTLPPAERDRRLPLAKSSRSSVALEVRPDGRFRLTLRPTVHAFVAAEGERVRYPRRETLAEQDWLKWPVSGVSYEDVEAYAAWLDRTGRVPGARLCTEHEWERAARGADDRLYPSGDSLEPGDANRDVTYGRDPLGFGPDEVGSHPGSRSPYGVDDLAGNVWEWTRSVARAGEVVYRGGSWYQGDMTSRIMNREPAEPKMRSPLYGARLCAGIATRPAGL